MLVFEDKLYPFCGNVPRAANMVNVALPARSGGDLMRQAVTQHWLPALERFQPQLIFISAGFDGHRDDDMGNLGLVEADYAWITTQIADVAQRGYDLSSLARSASAHVRVLLGLGDQTGQ